MAEEQNILDSDEARETGERFILDRFHHGANIISDKVTDIIMEGTTAYQLEGVIDVHERGFLGFRRHYTRYTFRIVVDGTEGGIMSWEVK